MAVGAAPQVWERLRLAGATTANMTRRLGQARVRRRLAAGGLAVATGAALALCCIPRKRAPSERLQRVQHSLTSVDEWIEPGLFVAHASKPPRHYSTPLIAHRFDAWAYTEMDPKSARLGSVRESGVLWGKREPSRRGCKGGWYALAQGGYACASGSFRPLESASVEPDASRDARAPALESALPYRYVQVTTPGAPRYRGIPTPEAERAARSGGAPDSLDVLMEGDYFLAIIGEELDSGRHFYRTLRGEFVRVEDVAAATPPALHGTKNPSLPLAFVVDDAAPVVRLGPGGDEAVGAAPRYSRFRLAQTPATSDGRFAVGDDGLAVAAKSVRVARAQPRPPEVGVHERWIAIDLSEQALVAYEGDRAVFATLISSGKPGHDTPTGTFRVREKHISTTMRGEDPIDGPYEVQEVPWTMYYSGGYALHGAYWHDAFGRVRSHGCTNIAPADARWLLRWTDPELPAGWHSVHRRAITDGTRIYISN
jgi:lipoprotein-anchoring transpeptidase ErfK/SrfK